MTGTVQAAPGFEGMGRSGDIERTVWLVCNAASGSNDADAVRGVKEALAEGGFKVARTVSFPDEPAPAPVQLDAAGAGVLAIFGGDGTMHAAIARVFGWSGAVLPLPGGTMNMLSKRLHGDVPAPEIISRLADAPLRRVRLCIVRTRHGMGLSGVLAGPGAIWNEVREAMRAADLIEFVATTREAIHHSANGPKVVCEEVDCGREEGYSAITVTPHHDGLQANGYYAETLGDYAGQGIALLNRNFRKGPHDELGRHPRIRLVCPDGEPMGLLIDGEPFDGHALEEFALATCDVDLIATTDEADAR